MAQARPTIRRWSMVLMFTGIAVSLALIVHLQHRRDEQAALDVIKSETRPVPATMLESEAELAAAVRPDDHRRWVAATPQYDFAANAGSALGR